MKTTFRPNVAAVATAMAFSAALQAQTLSLSPSGLLAWTENATQQVVVCTESLQGLWAPLAQTISRAQGQSSVAIDLAKPSQFFRLKPGWQFHDEFDGSQEPWRATFFNSAESTKHTFTYTNGVLRIEGASNLTDGRFYLQPPAFARTNFTDFHASVDVVDWPDTGSEQIIGILARWTGDNAYIAELWRHCRYLARKTALNIWDGTNGHPVEVNLDPDRDYRLVFVTVTNRLACHLYDLSDLQTPVRSIRLTNNTMRTGQIALYCSREYGPGLYDVTVDNFAVTGTRR